MKKSLVILFIVAFLFAGFANSSSSNSVADIGLKWVATMALDHYYHFTAGTQANIFFPTMNNLNNTIAATGTPKIDKMYGFSYPCLPIFNMTENQILEGELNFMYGSTARGNAVNRQYELAVLNPSLAYLFTRTFEEDKLYGSFGFLVGVNWAALVTRNLSGATVIERSYNSFAPAYGLTARLEYGTKLDMTINFQTTYRFSQMPDFVDEFGNTLGNSATDLNGFQIGVGLRSWF